MNSKIIIIIITISIIIIIIIIITIPINTFILLSYICVGCPILARTPPLGTTSIDGVFTKFNCN